MDLFVNFSDSNLQIFGRKFEADFDVFREIPAVMIIYSGAY
jgi:AAA+ ATPase superfamily predicted ATPase